MSNAMTTTAPVGFIGLGIMGAAMARNVLKAGFKVAVHNRSRGKVEELVKAGAQMFAALCATGRDGLDNAALGLLFEELSGIKR